ncbi:MAG: hypothetical protein HC902_06180 [Calothrix sp. SM1_5_4]|nr:hypothetical protein [Calothrix sp. SM1_5_4]
MDQSRQFLKTACAGILVLLLAGCGQIGSGFTDEISVAGDATPDETVSHPDAGLYKPEPLLWEAHVRDGLLWSAYTYRLIGGPMAAAFLPGTSDIAQFCPNYNQLSEPQRVNFWAYLISAVAKYESGFDPVLRYHENTMGLDEVTGQETYSEGLLQLSYKDSRTYGFCDFNWEADRKLPANDPRRTILDPINNLDCGIRILASQVGKHKKIALDKGAYWAVLRPEGAGNKLAAIKNHTKSLPFCARLSP